MYFLSKEAGKEVDVENIQHIANDKETIGDVVGSIVGAWKVQKEAFCERTGSNHNAAAQEHQQNEEQNKEEDDFEYEDFGRELEMQLYEEEPLQQKDEVDEFSHYYLE